MLDNAPLTVVLVHGAFADASSWNGVVERLQAAGLQVRAPANPLRGIAYDSADIARLGRGCDRRQGGRHGCDPLDGRTGRSHDHRGRRLTRDHGFPAGSCRRGDPDRGSRGRPAGRNRGPLAMRRPN